LFAKANGFDASKISWKNAAASAKTALMLQGQADAVSIYQPAFPSTAAKVPAGQTLGSFNFGERGVDIYGDGLIGTDGYLRDQPEIARSFVQASMRGYRDAFSDPAAAVDALLKNSPELDRGNGIKEMEIMKNSNSGPIPTSRGLGFHDADKMAATYRAVTEVLEQPIARPVTDFYTNDYLASVTDALGRAR
jgi:NitT/TauT family transport system substrate-binding protein